MKSNSASAMTRREMIAAAAATVSTLALTSQVSAKPANPPGKFRFSLNMSTIRGHNPTAEEEVDIAGNAGYDAIEPWLGKLHEFVSKGGSLKDLRKRIEDHGLTVESGIGFAKWLVDDDAERAKGMEEAKRDMDVLAQIGGKRMAAPPAGIQKNQVIEHGKAVERYRALLELGDSMGVVPELEMWGGNSAIGNIPTALYIALETGHPKACFLGDIFHVYKSGGSFESLRLLSAQAVPVFHFNDYPADPPRNIVNDSHRIFPGDGVAPLKDVLHIWDGAGAHPVLSLELFNREYWKLPAMEIATTGLKKMRDVVKSAGF